MEKKNKTRLARAAMTLLLALLTTIGTWAQETLTVHDGTTTNNVVPAYMFYFDDFTRSQFVIPADDLAEMEGGTISSIKFYTTSSNVPYTTVSTVDVFLMEVDYTTMTALEPKEDGTIVYQGTLDVVTEGEGGSLTITLSTPYTYSGGNLLIGIENTTDAGYKNINFYGKSVTGASWGGSSSTSLSSVTGSQRNFIPKTTFTYDPASTGCDMPTSIAVSSITHNSATVTWDGEGSKWNLRYKASTDADYTLVEGLTSPTYTFNETLVGNTTYIVGVQTDCGDGSTSTFRSTSFTTENPCAAPTDLKISNITTTSATLTWTAGYQETEWTVKYKASTAEEWIEETVSGSPTLTLTGLSENTTYNVRVYNCPDDETSYVSGNFKTVNPSGAPTNLHFSDITISSATLSWTPCYQETSWTVKYKKAADSEYIEENVNGTPILTLSGLESLTTYNVQVYNGESCVSGNFTTGTSIPLVEGFGTSIPTGWALYTGLLENVMNGTALSSTSYGWSFGMNNGVFDNHARVNIYGTSCYRWLVMPTTKMEDNVQLTFDLALTAYNGTLGAPQDTGTDDKFVVLITTDGGTTWTVLRQWDNAGSEYVYNNIACSAVGQNVSIDLSSYAGQNIAIAFYGESTVQNADNNLHIDNVSIDYIPNCAKPTGLAVSNVTAHEATISWVSDATEWVVAYKTADEENFTEVEAAENPYTLSSLTPETTYSVKVRANCGSGNFSDWTNTASFTTTIACPAPTELTATLTPGDGTVATLSWTEPGDASAWVVAYKAEGEDNFIEVNVTENPYTLTGLTPETAYTAKVKAVCGGIDGESQWSSTVTFTPTNALKLTVNDGTTTNSYVPVYGLYVDDYSKSQFIIPAADLAVMQYGIINKLTFYSSNANVNWGTAEFEVYMTEVNNTTFDDATLIDWTTMDKVKNAGSLSISGNKMEVVLDATYQYMGGNLLIGVLQTTSGTYSTCSWYGVSQSNNVAIGGYETSKATSNQNFLPKTTFDYEPSELPACVKPKHVAVNDITTNSATISWDGTSDSYQIQYRKAATSQMVAPAGSYADNFEKGIGNWTTIDADGDGYTWVSSMDPGVYHNSGVNLTGLGHNNSARFVISGSYANQLGALTPDNYLVSPQVELGKTLTFWACAQDASYPAEHFGVAVSTTLNDDPDAFTTVQEWTLTAKGTDVKGSPGATRSGSRTTGNWYQYTVDLSEYSGLGYIAIRHFNCTDQFILNLDDFQYGDIEVVNTPAGEWMTIDANDTSIELTELENDAEYEYRVRGFCTVEDAWSDWTNIGTFTTEALPLIKLSNGSDNTATIAANVNAPSNIILFERTLFKDGTWNTFCVPFDVALANSPLAEAKVMELDVVGTYDGHKTGREEGTDNYYLFFKDASSIKAGKPYFVKWTTTGANISSPEFKDVTITTTEPTDIVTTGITMKGNFSPVEVEANDMTTYFLMGDNKLYYTTVDRTLYNFRAYFKITDANGAPNFTLGFDEGGTTRIFSIGKPQIEEGAWYDLNGRKYTEVPTAKGLYIHNGVKVIVK